ncbi:MAG: ATP-binding protein [Siculibacillus sp.]|nr:ATP-binding protein [Siculibacillus sp.]
MGTRGGLRRRLMLMAAGVIGVILIAEGLAWVGLDRLERRLGATRADALSDVRRVLTLAESASGLSAFAHSVTEIHDRPALAVAERALEGRLEEFAALAAALPVPLARPALPTLEPAIVRLADRLDGILRHLFAVTEEAIAEDERPATPPSADRVYVDPRQRFLLAATDVAATEMSRLVRDFASLVERSDRARAEATAADLALGKLAAGLVGVLGLVVALGFANAFLRGVVADLLGIAEAMRRLAGGDTTATAPGGHRPDEIGALARAFEVFKVQAHERAEIEGRLRHAERLEAIGRLTGGIAHDFNNLLTAVSTNLQLIHDDALPGSRTRTRALRALAAAENGAAMVDHLLAFGRRQMLAPVATDVRRLIAAAIDLVAASLGGGIVLERRRTETDDPLLALIDPGQLENALINLVFNARDAVGERGRITLAAARAPDGMVRLEVSDDGVGMDPATLARIFEPFFTTKSAGAGSGLGLSMVYGFVRQSGGRIDVASTPGAGTTVIIDLPAAPADGATAPAPPTEASTGAAIGRSLRILVVEDDARVREAIVELLAASGHTAIAAGSGVEALMRFDADAGFDAVVTDLALQNGMDGDELAAALEALRPGLPVLVTTGYVGAVPIDRPVLMKPFRREDLDAALARLLATDPAPTAPVTGESRPSPDPG